MNRNHLPYFIEMIWIKFSSGLKSFIISRVKDEADASDILQETFLKIHENINTLKDITRIKPWVYQITRNLINDYYRGKKYTGNSTGEITDISLESSPNPLMDTAVNDMIGMMDKLSHDYCEALCLTGIEGLSQKEYAEKTGLSYSGAKSRVQRARVMLKDMLLNCCHYQFDRYGTVFEIQPHCCCCANL